MRLDTNGLHQNSGSVAIQSAANECLLSAEDEYLVSRLVSARPYAIPADEGMLCVVHLLPAWQ